VTNTAPKSQNSCANASFVCFVGFSLPSFVVPCSIREMSLHPKYTPEIAGQTRPEVYIKLNPCFFFAECRTMNRMKMNSNTRYTSQPKNETKKSTNPSPNSKTFAAFPSLIPMIFQIFFPCAIQVYAY